MIYWLKEANMIDKIKQNLKLRQDKKDPPRIVPISVPVVLADNVFFLMLQYNQKSPDFQRSRTSNRFVAYNVTV